MAEELVRALKAGAPELQERAIAALSKMMPFDDAEAAASGRLAIQKAGGIVPLVALATDGAPELKMSAAAVLWRLGADGAIQVEIHKAGGTPALVAFARDGTREEKAAIFGHPEAKYVKSGEEPPPIKPEETIESFYGKATLGTIESYYGKPKEPWMP